MAAAAYTNLPDGMEPGLENVSYYDPPNLTFPFGTYVAAVEVDPETGVWDVLKMVAVDDCGVRINPMIVEGQIMGGLTEGYAIAAMQRIDFDAQGASTGSTSRTICCRPPGRRRASSCTRWSPRARTIRWEPGVGSLRHGGLAGSLRQCGRRRPDTSACATSTCH